MPATRNSITLCAIMRDEGPYILEWVAFHKVIGFDRIAIYDNGSQDGGEKTLARLAEAGEISHVLWPNVAGVAPQRAAYADALVQARTDWIAFLDADEFLNLQQDNSVDSFLSRFPGTVGAVALNWRIFGSSGLAHAGPDLVIDRFTRCSHRDHHLNRHLKTIARVHRVTEMHVHRCFLNDGLYVDQDGVAIEVERMGFTPSVKHSLAQINHYVVKSKEEFWNKKARGNANRAAGDVDKFTRISDDFFGKHDLNDEQDASIQRFRRRLIDEMDRLSVAAGIDRREIGALSGFA